MKKLVGQLIERGEERIVIPIDEPRAGLSDDEQPKTLGAILGLSVERLSPDDQVRFAKVSVVGAEPATWDAEFAARRWECSLESAESTISQMAQRGIVERRGTRYWMHALLADYGRYMLGQLGT